MARRFAVWVQWCLKKRYYSSSWERSNKPVIVHLLRVFAFLCDRILIEYIFCWWLTSDIEYRVHTCECVIRFSGLVSVVQSVRPTFTPAPSPAAHVSSWSIRPAMTCWIYGHASFGMFIKSNNIVWLDASKQCTTHTVLSFQWYYCATWKCESKYLIHFRILLLQIYPCTFLNLLIRILRALDLHPILGRVYGIGISKVSMRPCGTLHTKLPTMPACMRSIMQTTNPGQNIMCFRHSTGYCLSEEYYSIEWV